MELWPRTIMVLIVVTRGSSDTTLRILPTEVGVCQLDGPLAYTLFYLLADITTRKRTVPLPTQAMCREVVRGSRTVKKGERRWCLRRSGNS